MTPPGKPQQQPQEEDSSKKAMELQFPVKVEFPLWPWHIQDDSCYSPEAYQYSAITTDPSMFAPDAPQHSAEAIFDEAPQASGSGGTNLISEPVSSIDYQLQDFGTREEHKPPTIFEATSRNTSMPWDDHDSNTKRTENEVQPRSQKAQTSSMDNNTSATNVVIIDIPDSPTENEPNQTLQADIGETLQPYQRQLARDIREINKDLKKIRLEVASAHEPGKGTVVRCTYQWKAFNDAFSIWSESAATLPSDFSVDFVVPTDYPHSLPQIINGFRRQKIICSNKKIKDALKDARSAFWHECQGQDSLRELARVWGECIQYFCK